MGLRVAMHMRVTVPYDMLLRYETLRKKKKYYFFRIFFLALQFDLNKKTFSISREGFLNCIFQKIKLRLKKKGTNYDEQRVR